MIDVSVITILKRRHIKIEENLQTLVNQTKSNVEIFCIYNKDNSSIDQKVKDFQEKYNNIKIIYKTKAQDVVAKNEALKEAKGKYILITNGDTCYEKGTIEKLYESAEENNSDMAICGYNLVSKFTNKEIYTSKNEEFDNVENLTSFKKAWAFLNLGSGNKLIKKDSISGLEFGNYDDCQDEIFILNTYSKIDTVSFVKENLYFEYKAIADNSHPKNKIEVKDFKDGLLEVRENFRKADRYGSFKNILSLIAFRKVGVRDLLELSYDNSEDMKSLIRENTNYLDINFFEWRKNKYLSFSKAPNKLYWFAHICYKCGFQSLFLKLYKFAIDKMDAKIEF